MKEEENSRSLLGGMKMLTDSSYDRLLRTKDKKNEKDIIGTHTYNILADKRY